jgi:hypothetical protein
MLAINITCSRCQAVQQFDYFPAGSEGLQCKRCGLPLKACTGWIGPRSVVARHEAQLPDDTSLHGRGEKNSMDKARAAAGLGVAALVLLFTAVAWLMFALRADEPVANLTEAAHPLVLAAAAPAKRDVILPAPPAAVLESAASGPVLEGEAEPDLAAAKPPAPAVREPEAKRPEFGPAAPAPAPPPMPIVGLTPEQKRINAAIDRGVKFLRSSQYNSGRWDVGAHPVGYAALPGLTLLECGVPASDPAVQRAAKFVRGRATTLSATYELSLAILFLDRLGDSRDRGLIQTLAMRLIAGQNAAGGWSYYCPVLSRADHQQLLAFLQRRQTSPLMDPAQSTATGPLDPLGKDGTSPQNLLSAPAPSSSANPIQMPGDRQSASDKGDTPAPGLLQPLDTEPGPIPETKKKSPVRPAKAPPLPANLKGLPVVRMNEESAKTNSNTSTLRGGPGDNSNTQFAMLALWVARRHGVPMERTLALIEQRFQTSQNGDGGWGYHTDGPPASKPSMTCVGLLGLAIGHGFAQEMAASLKNAKNAAPAMPRQDLAIERGLRKLGEYLEAPQRVRLAGAQLDLYTLWSIERVGVLYQLKTIGGKDWYAWSTRLLVADQNANGSWWGRGYHGSSPTIDTCLALLILRRTNLVQDLSENLRLRGITEPEGKSRMSPQR